MWASLCSSICFSLPLAASTSAARSPFFPRSELRAWENLKAVISSSVICRSRSLGSTCGGGALTEWHSSSSFCSRDMDRARFDLTSVSCSCMGRHLLFRVFTSFFSASSRSCRSDQFPITPSNTPWICSAVCPCFSTSTWAASFRCSAVASLVLKPEMASAYCVSSRSRSVAMLLACRSPTFCACSSACRLASSSTCTALFSDASSCSLRTVISSWRLIKCWSASRRRASRSCSSICS
mmetsp:Transcript_56833/g.101417  ORF Transcript_56833/g.101417 Transcript_56833/m.101417 type:complete len:238 (-) Transcript_56833:988-1701(-)